MKDYYSSLSGKRSFGPRWAVEWNMQRCAIGFQWSRWIPALWIGPLAISYDRKPD